MDSKYVSYSQYIRFELGISVISKVQSDYEKNRLDVNETILIRLYLVVELLSSWSPPDTTHWYNFGLD